MVKRIIGILVLLFLSSSLVSVGKDNNNFSTYSYQSLTKEVLKSKTGKKSTFVLFEKTGHHKSPIKPTKKKKSRGVEPVHYFLCDLREQFVFNSFHSHSTDFYFTTAEYYFNVLSCHNKRGPPSLI